jgi:hypothetical protein
VAAPFQTGHGVVLDFLPSFGSLVLLFCLIIAMSHHEKRTKRQRIYHGDRRIDKGAPEVRRRNSVGWMSHVCVQLLDDWFRDSPRDVGVVAHVSSTAYHAHVCNISFSYEMVANQSALSRRSSSYDLLKCVARRVGNRAFGAMAVYARECMRRCWYDDVELPERRREP